MSSDSDSHRRILQRLRGAASNFDRRSSEQSIPARFQEMVQTYPTRVAIRSRGESLTYESLNRTANRLANLILKRRGDASEPVLCLFDPGIFQIASILGILKTGKTYVSLDPSFPPSRLSYITTDSQSSLLVTGNSCLAQAGKLAPNELEILNLDQIETLESGENPGVKISPDSLANLFYTSGSTGTPKGVTQNHRNVLHNALEVGSNYRLSPDDRVALLISSSFAASQTPIFGALLNGSVLCPFNLRGEGLVKLAEWLIDERITFFLSVPSTFRRLCETLGREEQFPDLRLIVLGGEVVTKGDVELFKENFSDGCVLCVRLASTETFRVRAYLIDKETEVQGSTVPVGYGVADKEVVLLDDQGLNVGMDQIGEITVRSRYISPGYWNQPELSKKSFREIPNGNGKLEYRTGNLGRMGSDGCLEFLGRQDHQVKIRGHRVELGEIEQTLLGCEEIREVVVTTLESSRGEHALVAYIVPTHERPEIDALRRKVGKSLPDFMVPSHFVILKELPMTPTGKVDYKELPRPSSSRPKMTTPYIAPRNELELGLQKICEEVLEIHPIGVEDSLVDLGADSFHFVHLAIQIETKLGSAFPLDEFHRKPTIKRLVNLLRTPAKSPPDPDSKAETRRSIPANCYVRSPDFFASLAEASSFGEKWLIARRVFIRKAAGVIPYGYGARLLSWLCCQPWALALFFQRTQSLLRRCLPLIETSRSESEVVPKFLANSIRFNSRTALLAGMSSRRFNKWVKVKGISNFRQALEQEKGLLLLNSHYGLPHLDMLILNRLGIDNVLTVNVHGAAYPAMLGISSCVLRSDCSPSYFGVMSVDAAETTLRRGGVVRIAGDGQKGTGGIKLPFCNCMRRFRTGFARLALATGAEVVPVLHTMDSRGVVQLEFWPPLDRGEAWMSSNERIELLVRQYVSLLENSWREKPENIWVQRLVRFQKRASLDEVRS